MDFTINEFGSGENMKKERKVNKKNCSACGLEAALARKVCVGCNTPFYVKHIPETIQSVDIQDTLKHENIEESARDTRRRPERIMRGRPHFYDASEFQIFRKKRNADKIKKKYKVFPSSSSSSSSSSASSLSWAMPVYKHTKQSLTAELRRKEEKLPKEMKLKPQSDDLLENILSPLEEEKLSTILEELNRKFRITTWRV